MKTALVTASLCVVTAIAPGAFATNCENLFQEAPSITKASDALKNVKSDLVSEVDMVLNAAIGLRPTKKFVQIESVRHFNSSPTGEMAKLRPDGYWVFGAYVHYNIVFVKPRTGLRSQFIQVSIARAVNRIDGLDRPTNVVRLEVGYDPTNPSSASLRNLANNFTEKTLSRRDLVPLAGANRAGDSTLEIILDGLSKSDANKAITFVLQLAESIGQPVAMAP